MNYIERARAILATKIDVDYELLGLYTLLVLSRGINTRLIDVHDAWAIWRNKTNPAHKSLVPFADLTKEIQELDQEYVAAIHATAREIGRA